jgi:hypothetical protein
MGEGASWSRTLSEGCPLWFVRAACIVCTLCVLWTRTSEYVRLLDCVFSDYRGSFRYSEAIDTRSSRRVQTKPPILIAKYRVVVVRTNHAKRPFPIVQSIRHPSRLQHTRLHPLTAVA